MRNLMRAFFFKLFRDWTFRITLFIGLGLAVFLTLIYWAIDHGFGSAAEDGLFCTGENLLISSLSPAQNFGIAVPINLISFTVLEFTHGTIRNKIIAGNSKGKIYLSLLLSGLTFTFLLIIAYAGLCTGLASLLGGFHINGSVLGMGMGKLNAEYLWKYLVLIVLAYALITFIAVFFATLFRSIGPCIPIVIILVLFAYFSATILGGLTSSLPQLDGAREVLRIVNPFYSIGAFAVDTEGGNLVISNEAFFSEIINTAVYSFIFVFFGFLLFKKRDVK